MFPSIVDITPLLPPQPTRPRSIVDIIPRPENDLIADLLWNYTSMKFAIIQIPYGETSSSEDYTEYLQFPNPKIQALASSIVSPMDTNDEKMYKIEQWVQNNIEYVSDVENYGRSEMWTYPTATLAMGSGDCEDGAFLMHSLALHASIPPNRLRTYGGLAWADEYGLTTAGHAWTAYKRETDDQWIIADWCYWAKDTPIAERMTMKEDLKYVDDFFFVSATETVETPYSNRVRHALVGKGSMIDTRV